MSETPSPRRILHLMVGNPSPQTVRELANLTIPETEPEVLQLTEANARQALEKIFAADTVAVWGNLDDQLLA